MAEIPHSTRILTDRASILPCSHLVRRGHEVVHFRHWNRRRICMVHFLVLLARFLNLLRITAGLTDRRVFCGDPCEGHC